MVPTWLILQVTKQLILGVDFWNTFQIVPAISENGVIRRIASEGTDESESLHLVEDHFTEQEAIILFIEPTASIVEQKKDSLELPFAENPKEVERISTEHELSPKDYNELQEIVDIFKNINDGKLGPTKVTKSMYSAYVYFIQDFMF